MKKYPKILYCILHGSVHAHRYENVIRSWAKNESYVFYSDTEEPDKNIIKVTNRTDYHANEEKNVNAFRRLTSDENFSGYDFYFFCDNDTFVNTKNLEKFLSNKNINKDKLYGLKANSWPPDKTLWYCGGGAGYIVSNYLLFHFFNKCKNYNTGWSDVSVGLFSRENGIDIIHCDKLHSFPPGNKYNKNDRNIQEQISFHYIKTLKEMLELQNLTYE